MVKFKTLKYKHYRQAKVLMAREEAGEDVDDIYLEYAASLVEEWDFIDEDTGDLVSTDKPFELSLDQMRELIFAFNREFTGSIEVPKANAGDLPSTLTS